MASRVQIERNQKRLNIISVARSMFEEKGYENTSIDQIAQTVGIAKGSVYTYFESKQKLLAKVVLVTLGNIQNSLNYQPIDPKLAAIRLKETNTQDLVLLKYLPLVIDNEEVRQKISEFQQLTGNQAIQFLAFLIFSDINP